MTKEEQILQIAEEEFFRNGYLNTSMVTVAKRAGVTHAMVNYYFRSKEQLFIRILDTHTFAFIESLRSVMKEDGDFIQILVNAADAVFDTINADREFPFLIQDVVRNAPELLDRYREPVEKFAREVMSRHADLLDAQIKDGKMAQTTMSALLENMFQLVVSPFMMIPVLENVCCLDEAKINDYLARRKEELEVMIRARYESRQ